MLSPAAAVADRGCCRWLRSCCTICCMAIHSDAGTDIMVGVPGGSGCCPAFEPEESGCCPAAGVMDPPVPVEPVMSKEAALESGCCPAAPGVGVGGRAPPAPPERVIGRFESLIRAQLCDVAIGTPCARPVDDDGVRAAMTRARCWCVCGVRRVGHGRRLMSLRREGKYGSRTVLGDLAGTTGCVGEERRDGRVVATRTRNH